MKLELKLTITMGDFRIRVEWVDVPKDDLENLSKDILWKYFELASERIRFDTDTPTECNGTELLDKINDVKQ